jgi:hypothetical protein
VQGAQGVQGPAGINGTAIASNQFTCAYQQVSPNSAITFSSSVGFGTAIAPSSSPLFTTIVFQKTGTYLVHLSIDVGFANFGAPTGSIGLQMVVNGSPAAISPANFWTSPAVSAPYGGQLDSLTISARGDRLVQISSANTTLSFIGIAPDSIAPDLLLLGQPTPDPGTSYSGDCVMIITQLH